MKFYKISVIFLFLLMLSMGVACAEDANQTAHTTLETTHDDALSDNEASYAELENQINASTTGTVELERNYTYNSLTDKNRTFLYIDNKNLTIEGNHNTIDGNGKAGFLKVVDNSELTIKNLIIRNCNSTALLVSTSVVTLMNVTFEDNHDIESGSAIYMHSSSLTLTNAKFFNNHAPRGAAIYAVESKLNINNGLFRNDNAVNWAMIYGSLADIRIFNTTFANTTSRYATAVYNNYNTFIKKSKFINMHANLTAGAIAVKPGFNNTHTEIIDCEFVNVSSAKNGGALFMDISGDAEKERSGEVIINNTLFNNCFSEFGGAALQLGGILKIINSQFLNNHADENGGAVYTSYAELLISNTNFTNNQADKYDGLGGAVFFDIQKMTVTKSRFNDNVASQGGAIYAYDSIYSITDSQFANNGEDIRTYFDGKNSLINNCGKLNSTLNASKNEFIVRYNGEPIILNPTIIADASVSDSSFDLRKYGLVTPVKNQGFMGACWAFGAAGAFESAFLKATGLVLDVSENNIQNMGLKYSVYGDPQSTESGNYFTSAAYFLSWLGAINSTDDVYDELGKISSLSFSPNAYHIMDAVFVNVEDRNAIKDALIKYGALNLYVYGADSTDPSYSEDYKSVYNSNSSGNHYVALVGWNDTFSKNLFSKTAPSDGAWICKNSWGTDWGDGGYFYLSYYDYSLQDADAVGFVIENTERYDKLYQIEVGGLEGYNGNFVEYEDAYVAEGGNIIAAVGTYFEKPNTAYVISIYEGDNLLYSQSGIVNRAGYNTIKLDQYVAVADKSVFSVRIKSASTPILSNTRQQLLINNSYVVQNGKLVYLSDSVAPIKVYAYQNFLVSENIVKCWDGKDVVFTVEDAVDNVVIGFNGSNHTVPLKDGKGNVSLGALGIGEYDVTVYYKKQTFTNHISVRSSIDTGGVSSVTIGYNTQLTLAATLFDFSLKPLNGTEIGLKFDGETVKGLKTDEDGSIDIVIYKGNSIATHYLDIVNPITGESLRVTVNIVSRFQANSNVDMYYFDGHSYKVRVRDDFGNFVGKNEVVTVKIGKKSFNVRTDANGYATLRIPDTITPGKYTVTATYFGQTVKNTLNVKQVLKLSKVKVKKSAKKLVLKATLKQASKALKSKKVTFKFNGKKYSAKTDKKGVAKVTVKKAVLKKLKVGKKVKYQVSYLKNTVKAIVKVKK